MRNLLNFLAKYNHVIVFILLESLALYSLFEADNYHNVRFYQRIKGITARLERGMSNSAYYFRLWEVNEKLAAENSYLKESLSALELEDDAVVTVVDDTVSSRRYVYTLAEVINNSVNRQKNFITLDKGSEAGIEKDMAVISDDGVVGIIVGSSPKYSVAMSLLNIDTKISARLKANDYFGSLSWDGSDYRTAILSEIPQHVIVNVGDTIVTSGYSSMFPPDVMIGTIKSLDKSGSDFYDIEVSLSVDFKKLHFIDIVSNTDIVEQVELETMHQ